MRSIHFKACVSRVCTHVVCAPHQGLAEQGDPHHLPTCLGAELTSRACCVLCAVSPVLCAVVCCGVLCCPMMHVPHCVCSSHRFRRHDCKHIKLILEQLGVARKPSGWQQVRQGFIQSRIWAVSQDCSTFLHPLGIRERHCCCGTGLQYSRPHYVCVSTTTCACMNVRACCVVCKYVCAHMCVYAGAVSAAGRPLCCR